MADTNPARYIGNLVRSFDSMSKAQARAIGEAAIAIVTTRTKAGFDADGRLFVPYTAAYAARRQKRGLQTRPDLAVTGHMIGAMIPEQTGPDEITITFASAREAEKAAAHNYGVNMTQHVKGHSVSGYTRHVERFSESELRQRVENARKRYHGARSEESRKRLEESLLRARMDLENHLKGKKKYKHIKVSGHEKGGYSREQYIPQREFLDIRNPAEMEVLANAIEEELVRAFDQVA